jgi:hypothetical protein
LGQPASAKKETSFWKTHFGHFKAFAFTEPHGYAALFWTAVKQSKRSIS